MDEFSCFRPGQGRPGCNLFMALTKWLIVQIHTGLLAFSFDFKVGKLCHKHFTIKFCRDLADQPGSRIVHTIVLILRYFPTQQLPLSLDLITNYCY